MSSTAFVAATAEGKIVVYELNVDKYAPLCEQIIVQKKRTKLTHLAFNAEHPVVVAGDSKGHCTVLKLSPNLRKRPPRSKKDPRPMPVDAQQEHDKLQNLVNIVHRASEEWRKCGTCKVREKENYQFFEAIMVCNQLRSTTFTQTACTLGTVLSTNFTWKYCARHFNLFSFLSLFTRVSVNYNKIISYDACYISLVSFKCWNS